MGKENIMKRLSYKVAVSMKDTVNGRVIYTEKPPITCMKRKKRYTEVKRESLVALQKLFSKAV